MEVIKRLFKDKEGFVELQLVIKVLLVTVIVTILVLWLAEFTGNYITEVITYHFDNESKFLDKIIEAGITDSKNVDIITGYEQPYLATEWFKLFKENDKVVLDYVREEDSVSRKVIFNSISNLEVNYIDIVDVNYTVGGTSVKKEILLNKELISVKVYFDNPSKLDKISMKEFIYYIPKYEPIK